MKAFEYFFCQIKALPVKTVYLTYLESGARHVQALAKDTNARVGH